MVSTPSGRMPRSIQTPETPVPVPISTTARASVTAARKRRAAPPPLPIGATPTSSARARAAVEHLVLGDELLGVGPARRLQSRDDDGLLGRDRVVSVCAATAVGPGRTLPPGPGRAREQRRGGPLTGQLDDIDSFARSSLSPLSGAASSLEAVSTTMARPSASPTRAEEQHMTQSTSQGDPDGTDARLEWQAPSWEEIVAQHSARVYRLAYRLTGNPHDAEDLTQEVFVRVFRSLSSYTPGHLRGLAAPDHHEPVPRPGPPQGARSASTPSPTTPRRGCRAGRSRPTCRSLDGLFDDDVEAALAALPPDFRAAVVLCDIEGLSYEEIADVLGLKLGTVRSRIHRGRTMLRKALAHRAPVAGRSRYSGPETRRRPRLTPQVA